MNRFIVILLAYMHHTSVFIMHIPVNYSNNVINCHDKKMINDKKYDNNR